MVLDVLIVGSIVKDITPNGWQAGGSAFYAAAQFRRLGLDVGVVTTGSDEVDVRELIAGVKWQVVPAAALTSFENVYVNGRREQKVSPVSKPLGLSSIPSEWRRAPIVLLAPVFHDVEEALAAQLSGRETLIGLGAQGWLRRSDRGRVVPGEYAPDPAWLAGQVVFVSEEDLMEPEMVSGWSSKARIVVLTRGRNGATIWSGQEVFNEPAYATEEVDLTGAGDVFAAAFLYAYAFGSDAQEAGNFGQAAAALSVRSSGIAAIGSKTEIEAEILRGAAVGA